MNASPSAPGPLRLGLRATVEHRVAESDTAAALGSGDMPVLATPRLLALAEEATVAALAGHLRSDTTSVGTRVALEHLRSTPVGGSLTVTADLVHIDGRLVRFDVAAYHTEGAMVGHAELTRVLVERDRFLARSRG